MDQNCPTCHGTGRGVFGGPCGACSGRGQVGDLRAAIYCVFALAFVVLVIALVLS